MSQSILLVDDSRISRLMLKAIIESRFPNVTIAEAENAEQAITLCKETPFNYITLDMNMPGRDGLTVAPDLQAACPDVKIALLTANFQERVIDQAKEQGLTFIPKPITEDKILDYFEPYLGETS